MNECAPIQEQVKHGDTRRPACLSDGLSPPVAGFIEYGWIAGSGLTRTYFAADGSTILSGVAEVACPPTMASAAPPPAPPAAVASQNCAGDAVSLDVDALPKQVVNAPGTALLVKLCPATTQDRGFVVLCAPDGSQVAVQNVTPDNAPLGTPPQFEAWLLDGTPYAGALAALTQCVGNTVYPAPPQTYCAAGANFTRTDFWDTSTSPATLAGAIWQDALGAVVPAPAGAVMGQCDTATAQEFGDTPYFSLAANTELFRRTLLDEKTNTWTTVWFNTDGTVFAGPLPPDLTASGREQRVTQTVEPGCSGGNPISRVISTLWDGETGVSLGSSTSFIDSSGLVSTVPPPGWTLGDCPPAAVGSIKVEMDGTNLASGLYAATHDPDAFGSAWSASAVGALDRLQSITVTATKAGTPGSGNTVSVKAPGSGRTVYLVEGQTMSWSVVKFPAHEFIPGDVTVTAVGDAAATVHWTWEP